MRTIDSFQATDEPASDSDEGEEGGPAPPAHIQRKLAKQANFIQSESCMCARNQDALPGVGVQYRCKVRRRQVKCIFLHCRNFREPTAAAECQERPQKGAPSPCLTVRMQLRRLAARTCVIGSPDPSHHYTIVSKQNHTA